MDNILFKPCRKIFKKHPTYSSHIKETITLLAKKLSGEITSLDVCKMKGVWEGHLRIRKGDIRIILSVDEHDKIIHVKVIDFRGDVYK
ncbi:MAG TPA: type II toxin-antitoxin system RelE/ParE family toxin [Spirochaetota bacterium]|nr:type II toxin-antitoxin system RelE/ParE family toxin [Spirochaetota bacterium]